MRKHDKKIRIQNIPILKRVTRGFVAKIFLVNLLNCGIAGGFSLNSLMKRKQILEQTLEQNLEQTLEQILEQILEQNLNFDDDRTYGSVYSLLT